MRKFMTVSGLALKMGLTRQRVDQLIREKQIRTKKISMGRTFVRLIPMWRVNKLLEVKTLKPSIQL